MKFFFKNHEDMALAGIGILLAAILLALIIWSTARVSRDLSLAANGRPEGEGKPTFNLDKAKSLDLKGLSQ
jgi:hypothetical protein